MRSFQAVVMAQEWLLPTQTVSFFQRSTIPALWPTSAPTLVPALATTQGRRLRVMHVVLTLAPGGTERLVIDLARLLAPQVDSVVCCLDEPGEWAGELTSVGVPVVALRRTAGFRPSLGRRIAHLAAEHSTDVLHCHHYSPFVYGQIAGLLHRTTRVLFTEHGRLSDEGPSLKRRLVNPLLGRLPDAMFAVSADLRRHMLAEGLPGHRLSVIHNGIDPGSPPSSAKRLEVRHSLGLPSDAMVIATAGRLDPVKDFTTLIDAFAIVHQSQPAARLVIIGDGPERSRLEQHAGRLGIAAALCFTGYRNRRPHTPGGCGRLR